MPRVLVQTDDGITVQSFDFPLGHVYALVYMPPCPQNTGINKLLSFLARGLRDAAAVQEEKDPRRLSEIVMDRLHTQSYRLVRNYTGRVQVVVKTGLSFQEAQDHCSGPDARGDDWHDSYEAEEQG